ncbi:N-myc-interactor [Melopsittacus undulatus]|uniref:N-myc-interactor n=1 Tax=Melopsittacus undulatus TaxID=13146 RepID=UPI00146D52AD|nr:N-myc-interactor [Melopsittacus undulatus]
MDFTSPPLSLKDNGFTMLPPTDPFNSSKDELERLEEELKKWKKRVEEAEKAKTDLLLHNSSAMEEYAEAQDGLIKLKNLQEKQHKEATMCRDTHERELYVLNQENAELKREIEKLEEDLAECSLMLSRYSQINKEVAEMKMKFTHMEETKDNYQDMNTHCVFDVTTKIPFRLDENQVLLTFEDKEGKGRIHRKPFTIMIPISRKKFLQVLCMFLSYCQISAFS